MILVSENRVYFCGLRYTIHFTPMFLVSDCYVFCKTTSLLRATSVQLVLISWVHDCFYNHIILPFQFKQRFRTVKVDGKTVKLQIVILRFFLEFFLLFLYSGIPPDRSTLGRSLVHTTAVRMVLSWCMMCRIRCNFSSVQMSYWIEVPLGIIWSCARLTTRS